MKNRTDNTTAEGRRSAPGWAQKSKDDLPIPGSAYDYSCDCSVPGCPHHRIDNPTWTVRVAE